MADGVADEVDSAGLDILIEEDRDDLRDEGADYEKNIDINIRK